MSESHPHTHPNRLSTHLPTEQAAVVPGKSCCRGQQAIRNHPGARLANHAAKEAGGGARQSGIAWQGGAAQALL